MDLQVLNISELQVFIIQALKDNYVYLLKHPQHQGLIVVDPSEALTVQQCLKQQGETLSYVLNTHHHHDHVGGNHELKKQFHCQILCSAYDQPRVPDADRSFKEFELIHGLEVTAIPVPGHTLGHTALWLPKAQILFSGDTLFSLGCGRLFEGSHEQLYESLQKLKTLPLQTLVLCGHEYTATNSQFSLKQNLSEHQRSEITQRSKYVATELQNNRLPVPTTLEWECENNLFLNAQSLEEFRQLRIARDHFTV